MDGSSDRLIGALVADLRPVRPLLPPALRTLIWLILVAVVAVALAMFADVAAVSRRVTAIPAMWLAVLGSIATMTAAAFAAFELSLPDRSRAWALLPLPAAALWVGASGLWLHACVRAAGHPCRRDRRDAGLPAVHYRPVGAAVSGADRHAAARLFVGATADCGNGRPRFGCGCGHAVEFLPSFRRRDGRSRCARGCGADRCRCSAGGRQPDPAKFFCRACNHSAGRFEFGSDGIDTIAT